MTIVSRVINGHLGGVTSTSGKGVQHAPKTVAEVRAMTQAFTHRAVLTLMEVMENPEERGAVRLAAVELILQKAWGSMENYTEGAMAGVKDMEAMTTEELTAYIGHLKGLDAPSEQLLLSGADTNNDDEIVAHDSLATT